MTRALPRTFARATPAWAPWELPALIGVALLALGLRLHEYTLAPSITDNGDELDWTWQGLGLLRRGVPYGWSNIRGVYHPGTALTLNGKFFEVVHPYLDHPPLFGLLVGAVAWLQGARDFTDVTAQMIRPVPIACAVVALLLTYLLGRRVIGAAPAMVGSLLLATAPAAVLVQRQVEAEALLAPVLLGALILVSRVIAREAGRAEVIGLLACCAAAPLIKVSGVAVAAVLAAILLTVGRWRLAAAALAAGLTGTLGFVAYGAFYDWQQFVDVVAASEAGRSGILGVYHFIAAPAGPAGANLQLYDGWWLLGWLALALVIGGARERRLAVIGWPVIGYAVVVMLFAEHISFFGWFRVAVYPLVYLLAGWLAWRAVRAPSAIGVLLVVTVGAVTVISPLVAPGAAESWAPNPYLLIAALAVAVGPALVAMSRRRPDRWLLGARAAATSTMVLAVGANIAASVQLAAIYRAL